LAGFDRVIGFDMGGTSTDVSHFDGTYERSFETVVAGVRLRAPMMKINTVAAGGGSVCRFDGGRFRVGPDSAGANPGPASYRRGGPLTITDCNVMVGKLQPQIFPHLFGPDGGQALDIEVVREKFRELATEVERAIGHRLSPMAIAEGFLAITVDNMANAIKQVSVARGYDLVPYTLAGVLSAYGMGLAETRVMKQATVEALLDAVSMERIRALTDDMRVHAETEIERQGVDRSRTRTEVRVHIKYAGSDSALEIDLGSLGEMSAGFDAAYRRRFAFTMPGTPLVAESVSVEVIGTSDGADAEVPPLRPRAVAVPANTCEIYMGGALHLTPVFDRAALPEGQVIAGPAVIFDAASTTVVEPGWAAVHTARGDLVLERTAAKAARHASAEADPVRLEIFNNLFMSVAEQMGAALQNTAYSVNIKERLDFSCALFDAQGSLIANAPHMPVHLGSMGDSVRAAMSVNPAAGDVIALNNPYNGGTHLPDVTVVMPIYEEGGGRLLFVVAARGHHADLGGKTPGSMPSNSTTLDEEGVLIDNFLLVSGGEFREAALRRLLGSGRYPVRNVEQNLGDIKAQVAACARGARELLKLMEGLGRDVVLAYMDHVRANAAESVRRMLKALPNGRFRYEMDNGAVVHVAITVDQAAGRAIIDFTGTSAQLPDNFNAPTPICRAAVLYVVRTLLDDDIPMNDGYLEPIELVIPDGSMLSPHYPAAVVAGNVETSQAVTDALYGATGRLAAAQGTMNNFTFGNDEHQYYETICGGAGAGEGFDGTSAVHTHMTNSRLTDPEVLEWRFPVVVQAFHVRQGSGGAGRWRGGDGVVRRIMFREKMTASLLSNRRRVAPFGLDGGASGAPGRGWVERANGDVTPIGATAEVQVEDGDVFVIETPGGGGYGAA